MLQVSAFCTQLGGSWESIDNLVFGHGSKNFLLCLSREHCWDAFKCMILRITSFKDYLIVSVWLERKRLLIYFLLLLLRKDPPIVVEFLLWKETNITFNIAGSCSCLSICRKRLSLFMYCLLLWLLLHL